MTAFEVFIREIHMPIRTKQLTELLGDQIEFVPTRTDNLKSAKKKSDKKGDYQIYNAQQIETVLNNNKQYQNAKIHPRSAPKEYCWLVLDYDDHNNTGQIPDMATPFSLAPTFTIKTPTGAGKQEWYLIKEEKAKQLPRLKYAIPNFEDVEIFIAHKEMNWLFTAPGSMRDGKEYVLQNATQPVEISNDLFQTLKTIANHDAQKYSEVLDAHAHRFNTEIDSLQNKKEYLSWLNKQVEPFELGKPPLETGRDNFIYQCACQGFTYNLSKQTVQELIMSKIALNPIVISDYNREFSEDIIEIKINSAYNTIHSEEREQERVKSQELELFEEDEFGHKTITRKQYTKKVLYLAKYSLSQIMCTEQLRHLFNELVVYSIDSGNYYVPTIVLHDEFHNELEEAIQNARNGEQADWQGILSTLSDTVLHWQIMTPALFKETYKVPGGAKFRVLANMPEFIKSNSCHVYTRSRNSNLIINKNKFYAETKSPIEPIPIEQVKPKEIKRVNQLLEKHLRRIVSEDNYAEESSWLLDRYALLLQNPNAKIDNAVVLKGPQGSGKTVLIEILMSMFPRADTKLVLSIDELNSNFIQWTRIMHFDDVNINVEQKHMNTLKANITTSRISNEKKFQDRTESVGNINLSISTNDPIYDEDLLTGRRWTIFINESVFNVEDVREEVGELFIELLSDNLRLARVLHAMLLNRDVSNFKSNYKTHSQQLLLMKNFKSNEFGIALTNMIANYGYVNNEINVLTHDTINKNDLNSVLMQRFLPLENSSGQLTEVEDLDNLIGFQLKSKFHENPERKKRILTLFKEIFKPKGKCKSIINKRLNYTDAYTTPSIKDLVRLLAMVMLNNTDTNAIKFVTRIFHFEKQLKWNKETKPDISNLGNINAFENPDLEDLFEDDGDW